MRKKLIYRWQKWSQVVLAAKTRILAPYILLVAFSAVVFLVTGNHLLIAHQQQKIWADLKQEVEEFRLLVKGINPKTGQPFGDDAAAIFDVFFARNVPNENEFLIALLNHKRYKSNPTVLPESLLSNSVVNRWSRLTHAESGETKTSVGAIRYVAEPIKVGGKIHGVFVAIHLPDRNYEMVNRTVVIIEAIEGIIAVIALFSSLAWLGAGRILTRLRLLTETAHSITSSDLTQRIPVQGKDEITELTITFNEMLDRLQAAFNSQRDFINDAGHELRTPITIMRCYLDLRDPPKERRQNLGLVIDELDRMTRLVDDLLLLAKAERPDFLNLEIVEIRSLTEELYVKVSALATRNWCLDAKGSGCIIADRQRLTQAVLNLAQNAVQHTTEDDAIALGSSLTENNFRFWVRDTGEGIAPADQKQIFQRFARGSSGRHAEGTGLGLAIVKAIALAHSGRVELISQLGSGSTFTIVIPG